MFQIDGPGAVSVPPTPAADGTPGYFSDGTPGAADATVVSADWLNAIQRELIAFLTAAGVATDKQNQAQVLYAARRLLGKNMQVFTASGTFTPPAGVSRVRVRCWGAGGGGGMAIGAWQAGGAGGGGGYGEGFFDVTPGTGVAVTIGAGGTGGVTGSTFGQTGGVTSFGSLASVTGAIGGGANVNLGGDGGLIYGFPFQVVGQKGSTGRAFTNVMSAIGGASFGGAGGVQGVGDIGRSGMFPGGGGSGGATDSSGLTSTGVAAIGGVGAGGCIVVEW